MTVNFGHIESQEQKTWRSQKQKADVFSWVTDRKKHSSQKVHSYADNVVVSLSMCRDPGGGQGCTMEIEHELRFTGLAFWVLILCVLLWRIQQRQKIITIQTPLKFSTVSNIAMEYLWKSLVWQVASSQWRMLLWQNSEQADGKIWVVGGCTLRTRTWFLLQYITNAWGVQNLSFNTMVKATDEKKSLSMVVQWHMSTRGVTNSKTSSV